MQKQPREHGNSAFVDDQFVAYPDQWAILSAVRTISRAQVEDIVRAAERRGRVVGVRLPLMNEEDSEPWTVPLSRHQQEPPIEGELPRTLELVLGNEIHVATKSLIPGLRNRLLRLAAFKNPEFYNAQSMRLSTYGKPRTISCAEEHAGHIGVPRGCLDDVRHVLSGLNVTPVIRDERTLGQRLDVAFQGTLRAGQRKAADAMLAHGTGVLCATTVFGKTIVGAWLVAQRGVSTLDPGGR